MSARLSDLLDAARHDNFVGRREQLAAFDAAVAGTSPHRVLFVHGPGGVGKTTLLMELRLRARQHGRDAVLVEGRDVDPSPEGFRAAAAGASVLLVDGYELLAPIDAWLRDDFIPGLPAEAVVVVAGREPPGAPWRTDPGWRSIVGIHRLAFFDETECLELLARAGVAVGVQRHLTKLGRGHPLAMAMLADAAAAGPVPDTLAEVPDLVTALLETLVRDAPTPAHVAGLAACAKAWLTTEELLGELVGDAAPQVWAWLRQRPFIFCGPRGLWPHDLVREVLDAEFDRRFPERFRDFHRVIHDHVVAGLKRATGLDRQLLAQHLIYLHRRSPLTAAYSQLRGEGAAVVPARPADLPAVYAMADKGFTPTSRRLLEEWATEVPSTVSVVRTAGGVAAFACNVAYPTGSTMEDRDPVVRAVLDHVARTAPVRPGEQVAICRFLLGQTPGNPPSERELSSVLAGSVSSLMEWVSRPLAWAFIVFTDVAFYSAFFEYLTLTPQLEVTVDGVRHAVYGIDWRRLPLGPWLDLMNEREHSGGTGPAPEHLLRPPPLDRATFAAAVRAGLQDLHRPEKLAASPLAGTALGPDVRSALVSAVDTLGRDPKGEVLRSVLLKTYVRSAATQEAAAEALGLPFSTYRRHLGRALDQLVDVLWAVEIGEIPLTASR